MRTQEQAITAKSVFDSELKKVIDDFFQSSLASHKVEMLNYLLNQFVISEGFQDTETMFRANLIFDVTELSTFIVKLQEVYEQIQDLQTIQN